MAKKMRLDKFIASQKNDLSRSDVKQLCRKGRVTVNGVAAAACDMHIDADSDKICIDGEAIAYKEHIYIMLNKPQGVVCSTKDGLSPTVLSLVPKEMKREGLFPAGRLDKDTEGFVLITDDGELSHRILSPKNHVPKLYYVHLAKECANDYKERFEAGITLSGGERCMPAGFEAIETDARACFVTLHEGMFHQVKRMFEALGNSVTYLKRLQIGGLPLDEKLPLGDCMEIMHKEIEKIELYFDTLSLPTEDFSQYK